MTTTLINELRRRVLLSLFAQPKMAFTVTAPVGDPSGGIRRDELQLGPAVPHPLPTSIQFHEIFDTDL